ncbi:MAG: hypothetical protein JWM20_237 [Patescibacteria group bacterium]|nr:hypothetical protein [Patescibacteria group bacterium]
MLLHPFYLDIYNFSYIIPRKQQHMIIINTFASKELLALVQEKGKIKEGLRSICTDWQAELTDNDVVINFIPSNVAGETGDKKCLASVSLVLDKVIRGASAMDSLAKMIGELYREYYFQDSEIEVHANQKYLVGSYHSKP